uniref:NumbF domain-containing protein n=1 Tax=Schistocephalus solidus TaxID=70667 RepID=A0A183SB17_SCHSO
LPSLQAQSAAPVRQRPASNLQVFRDEPTAAGNSGDRHPFLHTRAPAPNATAKAKALTRLADPLSNWHAENTKKEADFTLNPQTASLGVSNTTRPSGITPTSGSRGTLNIFQDATPSHHQQPLPPRVDSQAKYDTHFIFWNLFSTSLPSFSHLLTETVLASICLPPSPTGCAANARTTTGSLGAFAGLR